MSVEGAGEFVYDRAYVTILRQTYDSRIRALEAELAKERENWTFENHECQRLERERDALKEERDSLQRAYDSYHDDRHRLDARVAELEERQLGLSNPDCDCLRCKGVRAQLRAKKEAPR